MPGSRRNLLIIPSLALAALTGCASQVSPPTAVIADSSGDGGTITALTGQVVSLDGSGSTDPQSLPLTFLWSINAMPAGSTAKLDSTNVVNPSFTADMTGPYVVSLVVSDGVYSSAISSITIVAQPCGGYGPQVTDIAFTQGPNTQQSSFSFTSPGSDAGAEDAGSGDAGVVDAGTPDSGPIDAGPADAGVDAGPVDAGPVPTPGVVNFDAQDAVQLSALVFDPDTDSATCPTNHIPAIYTYTWTLQGPPASAATLTDATSAAPAFTPDVQGTYVVALAATDANGHTSPAVSTSIVVGSCGNHLPSAGVTNSTAKAAVVGGTNTFGTAVPALNIPVTLTADAYDIDNGIDPISGDNCNPGGAFSKLVTVDWSFVSLPFGSHATLAATVGTSAATVLAPLVSNVTFTPDVVGTYEISMSGTDSSGRTSKPELVTVTVPGCIGDHSPTVTAIGAVNNLGVKLTPGMSGNLQGTSAEAISFQATVTDVDNTVTATCTAAGFQTFTYAWSLTALPAGSHATLNNPTFASPSLTLDVGGTYTVQVIATDSTGLSSPPLSQSVIVPTMSTACGDNPPTVVAELNAPLTAAWGQLKQIEVSNALLAMNPTCVGANCILFKADDPDRVCVSGLSLSFFWSFDSVPAGSQAAFLNPNVQDPSFTPDVAGGTYVVRVTATDNRGMSASLSWPITVPQSGANPPAVLFNSGLTSLNFTAGNGNGPPVVSGAQVGVPVVLDLGGCNGNMAQLSDADNTFGSVCSGTYGPQTFTFAWSVLEAPAGSAAQLLNATTISPSLVPDVEGSYLVGVVVTDSTGLSSSQAVVEVAASIAPCGMNIQPVLPQIQLTQSAAQGVGQPVQLAMGSPTNVDANGYTTTIGGVRVCHTPETFTYQWSFTSVPGGSNAAFNDPTAATTGFTPDVASGTWGVQVTVTDQQGRTATQTKTVTTTTCGSSAPKIGSPGVTGSAVLNSFGGAIGATANPSAAWNADGTVSGTPMYQLGAPITFVMSATDPNTACGASGALSYTWTLTNAPAGSSATLNGSGATASFTPDAPSASASTKDYGFTVTVTNSIGLSSTQSASFSVSDCGTGQPSVGNNVIVSNGASTVGSNLTFTANVSTTTVTDPNESCFPSGFQIQQPASFTLSWFLTKTPAGSESQISSAHSDTTSLVPDLPGKYDVGLVVTDAYGQSSSLTPSAVGSGIFEATIGTCATEGGSAPTVSIGAADCGLNGNVPVCAGAPQAPSTGSAPYACSMGETAGTSCLAASTNVTVNTDTWIVGSLTPPVNFSCLSTDTWATMTYQWSVVSVPAASRAIVLNDTSSAGARFTPDATGTYVVSLTVTNELGKSSSSFITLTK